MTYQSSAPLRYVPMETFNRAGRDLASEAHSGALLLDPPYQRGLVWNTGQQILFIRSLLTGVPVPSIIINQRLGWPGHRDGDPTYAVIDGKQRLTAVIDWFDGRLPVPASWFDTDLVEPARIVKTSDGPYVSATGLTSRGRAQSSRFVLPVRQAELPSVAAEAEIYLLVNGAGTLQSTDDLARAQDIAGT